MMPKFIKKEEGKKEGRKENKGRKEKEGVSE
jgi:hypothetical protein